jgi:TolB protein
LTPNGYYLQPAWSPSGQYVYFSSYLGRSGMNIWRIAVGPDGKAAGDPEPVTSGQGADMHPAPSRDGRKMIFSIMRANSDIWKMPVDPITGFSNGPPVVVVNTSREDSRGAWSPDEKWIAFNSDRDNGNMNLWVHPMAGGNDVQVTHGPGGDYQADWAPDGKALLFFSLRSGNADIWAVDLNEQKKAAGPPRQLTTDPHQDMNPFVSADGQHVAFMSDREGRVEVFVMNPDGRDQRLLSKSGTGGHFLRWRGNQVAFNSLINEKFCIALATLDAQVSQWFMLEKGQKVGGHMSLSPDGSAFLECWNHVGIYAFPPAGAKPQFVLQLTEPDAHLDYPVWSPSGKWVLFDRMTSQGGDLYLVEGLE